MVVSRSHRLIVRRPIRIPRQHLRLVVARVWNRSRLPTGCPEKFSVERNASPFPPEP
jgi:hypothetical protein